MAIEYLEKEEGGNTKIDGKGRSEGEFPGNEPVHLRTLAGGVLKKGDERTAEENVHQQQMEEKCAGEKDLKPAPGNLKYIRCRDELGSCHGSTSWVNMFRLAKKISSQAVGFCDGQEKITAQARDGMLKG